MDLIGHPGEESFVDTKGFTGFFLYEGLDKGISTECGNQSALQDRQ